MGAHHAWLHWWYPAFFALAGLLIATRARNFLNARTAWCGLRVAAGDGSSDDRRIEAAVQRRQLAEGAPMPIGLYLGGVCFVLAVVAAFGAAQLAQLYAALCLSTAILAAFAFWRLRNSQPTRAAVLAVRKSESVIPTHWFIGSAISGLLVLWCASVPGFELSAIIVGASTLITTYIAWRTTLLPAMLSGVDFSAEQLVDERLRFNRSTTCMVYALGQVFVFWCQIADLNAWQTAGFCLSIILMFGFGIWMSMRRYRPVRLA